MSPAMTVFTVKDFDLYFHPSTACTPLRTPVTHMRTHTHTHTHLYNPNQASVIPTPSSLTRREPLSLQRVWSQYSCSGCKSTGRTAAEPDPQSSWWIDSTALYSITSFWSFIYTPFLYRGKTVSDYHFVPEEETNYICELSLCTLEMPFS